MRWMRRVRRPGAAAPAMPAAQPDPAPPVEPAAQAADADGGHEGDRPADHEMYFAPWEPAQPPAFEAGPALAAAPPARRRRGTFWRATAIALAGAVVGGAAVYVGVPAYRVGAAGFAQITTVPVTAAEESAGAPAVAVYKAMSPSVVLVQNNTTVSSYYGNQSQTAWGSGVIFNSNGYIVTNDHVVAGATSVSVTLKDGSTYPATVVGGDASTDIAVIKINAGKPLPAATFANSSDVVPGELAIAIGNPLGPQFQQSVTTGVVGAVRPMLYGYNTQTQRVTEMIQTDAAINPGNSGGALFNAQGQVIGITSMKVAQTGEAGVSATGLGFAIPSNTVEQIVNDIVQYGTVKWAWLGIEITQSGSSSSPTAAETLTIGGVDSGGPSAGKLQPGDVITSWNGNKIVNYYDLVGDINAAQPGQTVALGITRGGTPMTVHITLGTEPASIANSQSSPSVQPSPGQTSPFPFPFPSFPNG